VRGKVAKGLRKECNRLGITPSGYRKIKKRYSSLKPEIIEGEWISVKRQKRAIWQDSNKCQAS